MFDDKNVPGRCDTAVWGGTRKAPATDQRVAGPGGES